MEKVWLKSYPAGVPAEIDINEFASINDMFHRSCRRFANNSGFRNLGTTITYAQMEKASRDFAAFLQSLPGLVKGSRIALMMPNTLQYPIALFGIMRAGMIVVNVNPLYTPRELEHQMNDSGAEVIVVMENFANVVEKVLPSTTALKHVITTQIGDMLPFGKRSLVNYAVKHVKKMVPPWRIDGAIPFRAALSKGSRLPLDEAKPAHDDIALLQYTGGTTGASKGAVLTHGNLVANVLQADAWATGVFEDGKEIVITALPLYHIFCLTTNCLLFLKFGGLNILITNPRDMPAFVEELKKVRFTAMTGVNTMFNALMNTPGFSEVDFSGLKFAVGGGAAVQRPVAERWQKLTGKRLVEGYGLTEASPFVSCNPLDSEYSGTIGLPFPSTQVSIRDDEGRELSVGEEGEIWVRGPQVMRGYWQRPDETKNVIAEGGWLRTGDIATMDERGYIKITDRKKDMILVSGFNVYPNEVESVIASMPGVLECAVVGVPDDVSGEAVKAFVVLKDPALTPEQIVAYCRERLTKYKVPKRIEFRTELPKNPVGKVLRRELRTAEVVAPMPETAEAGTADAVGSNV